jgi:formaldehyde-activating enzyme
VKIRGVVLEQTGGPLTVSELELAPPGREEVLVRLRASGVCHSDYNAVDGTSETVCPAVLGHEGAGVVEAIGADVTRVAVGDHVALSWTPWCGSCEECARDLPQLCSTVWPAMGTGGLMDGTPRLSRNGEPVYHYSFLSTFADACVVPERSCVQIADDTPFDVAALVGCAVSTGTGAVWRTAGVEAGDRVAIVGCGGVGLSALLAAVEVGAEPIVAVDAAPQKLDVARSLGATDTVEWQGSAEATAEAVRSVSGGGVDYAIEATGRPEAMEAAFLSTRTRGAHRHPARGLRAHAPGAHHSANGASGARLDLRLDEAGAGLHARARPVSGRAAPDRSLDLAPAAPRGGRARFRAHALRRCAAGGARTVNPRELDGRIGEGWSGEAPNGSHVNVVLAHRGSPTAAAAISMLALPSPGHTPVLVCVGETQQEYEPVWPPTLIMNKATAVDDRHQTLTWGAAQLGIGQGVLDAVADGLIEATGDLLVLVAFWVDPACTDETALRVASRAATRKALGVCVDGRDPDAAAALVERRDSLRSPFYSGE